jgi:hypothetical protein
MSYGQYLELRNAIDALNARMDALVEFAQTQPPPPPTPKRSRPGSKDNADKAQIGA